MTGLALVQTADLSLRTRFLRYSIKALVLLLAVFQSACGSGEPPSFILISLDTTRADHLGIYGYTRNTTPNLDALGREGLVLEQAVTVSNNTLIAHASLFTGLLPKAHGTSPEIFPGEEGTVLGDSYTTLAEDFTRAGYQTACFAAHPGWICPRFGMDQGFGVFNSKDRSAEGVLSEAKNWLDALDRSRPFFLFIHLYDVHSDWNDLPYEAPAPFQGVYTSQFDELPKPWNGRPEKASRFLRAVSDGIIKISPQDIALLMGQYDEGLAYTDHELGLFLENIRPLDHTYIVVTADHGEEFMEHGRMLHDSLYDEVARVPLILLPPPGKADDFAIPARRSEQVRLIDIRPTLLSLAGLHLPEVCQGVDLAPWLSGRQAVCPSGPLLIDHIFRFNGFKLIGEKENPQLYNVGEDPRECKNLIYSDEMRKSIGRMVESLAQQRIKNEEIRQAHSRLSGERAPDPDPEAEERLKALGYTR